MSNKTERTKAHIIQVFFHMMKEMGFDKITVAQLAKEAAINRGTFYLYFTDKYAILAEVEEDIYNQFKVLMETHIGVAISEKKRDSTKTMNELFLDACLQLMLFLNERKDIAQVMVGENGDPHFVSRLERLYIDTITNKQTRADQLTQTQHLQKEFVVAGAIAVVKQWLRTGAKETPEEISRTLTTCMTQSPVAIFEQLEQA